MLVPLLFGDAMPMVGKAEGYWSHYVIQRKEHTLDEDVLWLTDEQADIRDMLFYLIRSTERGG